jgi:hypothetical protein
MLGVSSLWRRTQAHWRQVEVYLSLTRQMREIREISGVKIGRISPQNFMVGIGCESTTRHGLRGFTHHEIRTSFTSCTKGVKKKRMGV